MYEGEGGGHRENRGMNETRSIAQVAGTRSDTDRKEIAFEISDCIFIS